MNRLLCFYGIVLFVLGFAPAASADAIEVSYEPSLNRISVRAKDATLSELFAQLAKKSGIGSTIDVAVAGDQLNVDQPMAPVTDAMRQILRRYSYMLSYRNGAGNRREIATVTILGPAGKTAGVTTLPPIEITAEQWQGAGDKKSMSASPHVLATPRTMDMVYAVGDAAAPADAQLTPSSAQQSTEQPENQDKPHVNAPGVATGGALLDDIPGGVAEPVPVSPPTPLVWTSGPYGSVVPH